MAIVLVALCGRATAADAAPDRARRWMTGGWVVAWLVDRSPNVARYAFDTPGSWVVGNERGEHDQVPIGYESAATLKYESYARFRRDVSNDRIEPSITAVAYDPEGWAATPGIEQRHPVRYMRRFAELAHAEGYQVLLAPALDLMQVRGAACKTIGGERLADAYVRCGIPGAAARYGDVVEVQAQSHERWPRRYAALVKNAAEQARTVNPDAVVLTGLSTSPGFRATARTLLRAWSRVRDDVNGAYFTVNDGEQPVLRTFLRRLRARERAST